MKKSLVAVACLLGNLSAFGQGYLAFANLGAGVNSPFRDYNGQLLNGSGYSVELLVGSTANAVADSLTPLFTATFSSGYFNGGSRTVPAADIDGTGRTWVIVSAWNNAGGTITSVSQAIDAGMQWGRTDAFQITPQSSAQVPASPLVGMPLINGTGNMIGPIPEPSIWTLGLIGVAAMTGVGVEASSRCAASKFQFSSLSSPG